MKKLLLLLVIILISCTQSKVEKPTIIDVAKIAGKSTVEVKKTLEKPTVIDVTKIAGKSTIEVEKILGKPDKIESSSASGTPCKNVPCQKAYYQKDKFEIVFINDKADWITINDLSDYDFSEDNIEIIGLPKTSPEFKNPDNLIRWKNIENIKEINIFNDGSNKISYLYIKVLTE